MGSKTNILMEKYEFGRLLGQGNFAKVYYGRRLADGLSVAIKVIDKEKIFKFNLIEQTKREISIMGLVKHPNILQIYEVMATKTKIYFVLEYAKGGELFNKLTRGRLKEDIARKYFQQLIMAVNFCHSRGVYHRDLKPENLLLDENKNLKVSDFGLSALSECKRQDGLFHTTCGTPAYVAPEVISRKGYDGAKADIWSCGVVLFVLVAGFLPFHGSNVIELYRKISRADYKCPQWFPPEVRRLLLRILDPNPDTRISMAEIMEDPWFKKGLDSRHRNSSSSSSMVKGREKDITPLSTDSLCCPKESSSNSSTEDKLEVMKPTNFNAFDIISLSTGFDLSGLFVCNDDKEEVKFTSRNSATSIVSKFEEVSRSLGMKVMKKDGGVMKLEAVNESQNGTHLCIDVEIFEIASSIFLVEIRRSSGDTINYLKLLKEDLKPALSDIVWAWQGKDEQMELLC